MVRNIQAALGLILLCGALYAQPVEDTWPDKPNLSPRPGDDIELTGTIDGMPVSITVGQMREALWYEASYQEARKAIFAREAMIEQRDNQLDYVTTQYEQERSHKKTWRTMFFTASVIFAAYMVLDVVIENY